MADEDGGTEPAAAPDPAEAPRKPYVKPELVEYGDVAHLTETGGPSTRDGTAIRRRTG